ncbi:MAG: oxygen-independent coproporphyrinogen III oxidase [Lachnospiraceae bacterium]|jgi:oxygen-independent coproporphyrinogen-3 oxidase|nr:oxygen-independent coproporphyrinogen III oxidase [Lachnospiraceae bacterium]
MKKAEIYIHIPFCVKKCDYCDFLSFSMNEEARKEYLGMLLSEIRTCAWATEGISVPTVFVGGGTPSLLSGEEIAEILEAVRDTFEVEPNAEITIEANPGTVTYDKLVAYRKVGVNRISFGLQSAQEQELQLLGRIHTYETFVESFQLARKAGFTNINVDLMSALPGQSVESYKDSLLKVCALEPEHISAYSLIIEEETPFYERYAEDEKKRERGEEPELLPSEDEERKMDALTQELLAEHGYERYEISNYAKPGMECKHNMGYWTRENYIGFGLGASSLFDNVRYKNKDSLWLYMHGENRKEAEAVDKTGQMEEFMFLGLRLDKGVSKKVFEETFHKTMDEVYGNVLKALEDKELINMEGDAVRLTPRGRDVSNVVLAEFLL